jgi:hypothetical protein
VGGADHDVQQLVVGSVDVQQIHARRGHHDVAGAHVGHADHAFEHEPAFGLDQLTLLGIGQLLDQAVGGVGAGRKELDQAAEQAAALFCARAAGARRA